MVITIWTLLVPIILNQMFYHLRLLPRSRKEAGRLLDYGTLYLYPVNKSQLATLNRTLSNFVLNETFRQWLMKARIGTSVRDVVTRLEPSGLCAKVRTEDGELTLIHDIVLIKC